VAEVNVIRAKRLSKGSAQGSWRVWFHHDETCMGMRQRRCTAAVASLAPEFHLRASTGFYNAPDAEMDPLPSRVV
jgi:hypothetical protein